MQDAQTVLDREIQRTRPDCGVYPSVTNRGGHFVLWHPDRKFFLLGKRIPEAWLADLAVPEA